jgi:hypothetical protein
MCDATINTHRMACLIGVESLCSKGYLAGGALFEIDTVHAIDAGATR